VTAVENEAAYLTADPVVASAVGSVVPYLRQETVDSTRVTLLRTRLVDERIASGRSERTHHFTLAVEWPTGSAAYDLTDTQHDLDAAVEVLCARLVTDPSHGGLWTGAAVGDGGLGSGGGVTVDFVAPTSTADLLFATLTYTATEEYLT